MSSPTDTIEFAAFHKPTLLDGEYTLDVRQTVQIDGAYKWGTAQDPWTAAPASRLQFAVAGPRFSLAPGLIQSQYPPPQSTGEYYGVLPHIILNRPTLPWERAIDGTANANATQPTPWMALLLFDHASDGGVPTSTTLTVQDLLNTYANSGTPDGAPEFVKILPRNSSGQAPSGTLKLEVGDHPNDRVTVIDVSKLLLWQILSSVEEIGLMSHVRVGQDAVDPTQSAEYPVILCNRLPAPGTATGSPVGSQSTVHLVSLEARTALLAELQTKPNATAIVRLISLASWSFSTLQESKTFTAWLEEAQRTDGIQTLRLPTSQDVDAERFLAQGYAAVGHQTRQGNHVVSWFRSPLLPGSSPAAQLTLPVRTSDELVRYFSDVGMFDTTYAAAWELGRMLTLRSKKVAVALFNWKRAQAQQRHQVAMAVPHLPFAPDHSVAPDFPDQASQWFEELCRLEHVPFHYLVPREEMLPVNSIRFFHLDVTWISCLLDGAFSVGRVTSADLSQDAHALKAGHVPSAPACSGFLLRSPVVSGWSNLGVEAYTQSIPGNDDVPAGIVPTKRLRFDRVGTDILLCLFDGEIQTVDIHEHPDTMHFGVSPGGDPSVLSGYTKRLRDKDSGALGPTVSLQWKSSDRRTLDIGYLAGKGQAGDSAAFGVTMIQGAEKVRFVK